MARINTYERDTSVSGLDLLVGSEFYLDSGVPKYRTKNYSVNDLSTFFGLNAGSINSRLSTYLGVLNEDGSFTYSTAFANQALTTVATAGYASASFVTNLGAIVGTLNADGTLSQLSQAFADQVFNTTATTRFASTSFATNLAGSFGTYNADGSIAALSSSFANNVLSTMNTSSLASASYVTNLSSSLGTFNADGTLASLSSSFADNVFSTMNTSTLASAASVTTLNAELILKPSITRAATAPSIQQEVQNGLGAVTTPQSPPNGSMWIDISTTAVTDSNGNVTQQPKNEMYVLAGSAGSVAWTLTKDATLLNTITSLATAEQSLTTVSNAQGATATFATNLAANFGSVQANGNGLDLSAGFADQILSTEASSGSSISELNTALSASVTLKPNIFRQNNAPTSLAIGDIWFDTNDKNKMYVAQGIGNDEVSSSEWILTADERLADTISSLATTNQNLTAESNARGALATFTTGLASSFGSANSTTGVLTGYSAGFVDSVMSTNNSAGSSISGINNALESLVVAKPDVFRQTEPPTVTAASGGTPQSPAPGSIWYDTNDNMVPYVLVATTWTKTTDERINDTKVGYLATATENISTISTRSSSTSTKFTNLAADYGSFSGDTFTPGLSSAAGAAITATVNAAGAAATAVNSLNASLNKVITATSQPAVNDVNIPVGSIWVDTSTGKNYVLTSGSPNTWNHTTDNTMASVTQLSTAIAGVDGKLEANYGIKVNAGGAMAGFELLAQESGGTLGTSYSEVRFQADKFKISTNNSTTASITPFTVSGNAVTMSNVIITGTLDGAVGSFTGLLTGNSGNIGGWSIANTTLSSSDGLLSLDSSSNSIIIKNSSGDTKVEITGSSSVTDPATVGNLGLNSTSVSTATISGSISTSGSSASKAASKGSGYVYDGNETAAFQNKTLTVKATLSNIAYNISGNSVGTGSVVGNFGIAVYTSTSSNTPIAISDFVTVTTTGSTTGNVSMPTTIKSVSITVPSSATGLVVRPYFGGGTAVTGNYGNQTTVTFRYPALSSVSISSSVNKVEISSGGMLVAASADQFFSLDKESNSESSPFIRSKGFMEHQGRLTILNSSGAAGSGDIYLGGTDNNNSGYMRIFSDTNSHKYIDWGDGNTTVQLKLRYNGSQKFQFGSTGVFDANSTKNFKINHLLESKEETHYLRHAAIEGPQADLIYRGKVTLSNGTSTVNLDEAARMSEGTFVLLCRDIQCFTSNETGWDAVKASVLNNMLTINCQNTNSSDEISWMVIAERKDPSYIDSDVTDDNGLYKTESEKED